MSGVPGQCVLRDREGRMLATWVLVAVAAEPYPWLGVELDPDASEALITRIYRGQPAALADLRAGDIIVSIDGAPIAGMDGCRTAVRARHDGDRVKLHIRRGADERNVVVKLRTTPPAREVSRL